MSNRNKILKQVESYYSDKVSKHGATATGVDWNSEESQWLRFDQLSKVFNTDQKRFSVLDYGCGYGAYYPFLKKRFPDCTISYTGLDISPKMLQKAREMHKSESNVGFISSVTESDTQYDYVIASGIFNVAENVDDEHEFRAYIAQEVKKMSEYAVEGLAFNALTIYSDKEYMRDYLHYSDPGYWFDYCKKNLGRNVALLHDYGLYEFTILIKKYMD